MNTTTRAPRSAIVSLWLLTPLLVAACATDQDPDNLRFGESVRNTIALQTNDPNAGAFGLDGEKAEKTMRAYRGDVGQPQSVENASIEF